ncbi:protein kinase domain-containing protein [Longispora albida]|uniref:protein kinase domain-containing protein n=1 Tax=Longispora albida TaxID=203523 RepID=UPI0003AB246D|nr:protein kinase [Longispora albida]
MLVLSGRYELVALVGRGGMGEVHRATDLKLGRTVAVKMLPAELTRHADFRSRFHREARLAAQLSHPGIATLHDVGEHPGPAGEMLPYLVMEFVDGRQLADLGTPAALGDVLAVAGQVLAALGHSHARGIVHRDIKPANILLTEGGVKVLDFGIARALAETATRLTSTGTTIGTPAYLSPEQIDDGPIDGRADLYALGCLLFELFTGHPPFTGDSPFVVMHQHLSKQPPDLAALRPDLPATVVTTVHRALAKHPADRFANAAEMRAALAVGLGGDTRPSTRESSPGFLVAGAEVQAAENAPEAGLALLPVTEPEPGHGQRQGPGSGPGSLSRPGLGAAPEPLLGTVPEPGSVGIGPPPGSVPAAAPAALSASPPAAETGQEPGSVPPPLAGSNAAPTVVLSVAEPAHTRVLPDEATSGPVTFLPGRAAAPAGPAQLVQDVPAWRETGSPSIAERPEADPRRPAADRAGWRVRFDPTMEGVLALAGAVLAWRLAQASGSAAGETGWLASAAPWFAGAAVVALLWSARLAAVLAWAPAGQLAAATLVTDGGFDLSAAFGAQAPAALVAGLTVGVAALFCLVGFFRSRVRGGFLIAGFWLMGGMFVQYFGPHTPGDQRAVFWMALAGVVAVTAAHELWARRP